VVVEAFRNQARPADEREYIPGSEGQPVMQGDSKAEVTKLSMGICWG
jgi:hypothetical protein